MESLTERPQVSTLTELGWSSNGAFLEVAAICITSPRPLTISPASASFSHRIWDKCRNAKLLDLQRGAAAEKADDPSAKFLVDGTFRDRRKASRRAAVVTPNPGTGRKTTTAPSPDRHRPPNITHPLARILGFGLSSRVLSGSTTTPPPHKSTAQPVTRRTRLD